jgi:hypothetical protein
MALSSKLRLLLSELQTNIKKITFSEGTQTGEIVVTIEGHSKIWLLEQEDGYFTLALPVMALPPKIGYGEIFWLLRRNFYDSKLLPFRVASDKGANIVLWGRSPLEKLTSEELGVLLNNLIAEAKKIREELGE